MNTKDLRSIDPELLTAILDALVTQCISNGCGACRVPYDIDQIKQCALEQAVDCGPRLILIEDGERNV